MVLDAYSPCVCGSGKKFKWCCAPVYDQVRKAYSQEANQQHEVALAILKKLTEEHPRNAAVWCYYAEMLLDQERWEEAEQILSQALAVDAHQPKALYLQGAMHQAKNELPPALQSYRRAADACDPSATTVMADIQLGIGQCEMILNRPIAAKAALDIAHRSMPDNQAVQERLNRFFGVESTFPAVVRKNYGFKKMIKRDALPADVLQATQGGKLERLHQLMEKMVQQLSYDPAFFYNLGLTRAWVGDNPGAVEALDQYVRQATEEREAAEAWTLAEALRLGIEGEHNRPLHFASYRILDFRNFVERFSTDQRIIEVQQNQPVVLSKRLDRPLPAAHENLATYELPRVQASIMILPNEVWIFSLDAGLVAAAQRELEILWGTTVAYHRSFTQPTSFNHLAEEAFSFRLPEGVTPEQAERLTKEMLRSFFEDQWAMRPSSSLQGNTPLDAAGHPVLRRKVLGMIGLWEQILALQNIPLPYSMADLRRKLGLLEPAADQPSEPATTNIAHLSAAELAGLPVESLSLDDLKQAFTAAKRLDANELATKFAQAVVNRPNGSNQADCFLYDQQLIFQLLGEDRLERAYATTLKAMERDAKQNGGKRSIDYRKLRLKVLLAGKRTAEAKIDLDKLLAEKADDLDLAVWAVEELLKFGQKEMAVKYAGSGKQAAEKKNDRDRAEFFAEIQKRFNGK
jgi:tetratricopeptide (TPR) repeat protein